MVILVTIVATRPLCPGMQPHHRGSEDAEVTDEWFPVGTVSADGWSWPIQCLILDQWGGFGEVLM